MKAGDKLINEEVAGKTIAIVKKGSITSTKAVLKLMKKLLEQSIKKSKSFKEIVDEKKPISVKDLVKKGKVETLELNDVDSQNLKKTLKKDGVKFSIKKDLTNGNNIIFFQAKDEKVMQQAFKNAVAKFAQKGKKKESVIDKLNHFKEKVKNTPQKDKVKQKKLKNYIKEYLAKNNIDELDEEFVEFLEDNEELLNAVIEAKIAFDRYVKEEQLKFETRIYLESLCKQINLMSLKETAKLFRISKKELIKALLNTRYFYKDEEGILLPTDGLLNEYFQVKVQKNKCGKILKRQIFTTARGRFLILLMSK